MSFINSYKPPVLEDGSLKEVSFQVPYDLNSNIPVPPVLETERLHLVPFIPAIHAVPFFTAFDQDKATLSRYLPGDWPTFDAFLDSVETSVRRNPTSVLFAIIDKTQPSEEGADARIAGRVAGIVDWMHASPANRSLEIGVIVLTAFQRTFVSANAIGLLLRYALDLPSEGGLGFRRVVWTTNPLNERSISAAEKMGFKKEGVMRWTYVLPVGKDGNPVLEGRGEGNGRDSVLLSVCWDDWVGGVRELVMKKMERV